MDRVSEEDICDLLNRTQDGYSRSHTIRIDCCKRRKRHGSYSVSYVDYELDDEDRILTQEGRRYCFFVRVPWIDTRLMRVCRSNACGLGPEAIVMMPIWAEGGYHLAMHVRNVVSLAVALGCCERTIADKVDLELARQTCHPTLHRSEGLCKPIQMGFYVSNDVLSTNLGFCTETCTVPRLYKQTAVGPVGVVLLLATLIRDRCEWWDGALDMVQQMATCILERTESWMDEPHGGCAALMDDPVGRVAVVSETKALKRGIDAIDSPWAMSRLRRIDASEAVAAQTEVFRAAAWRADDDDSLGVTSIPLSLLPSRESRDDCIDSDSESDRSTSPVEREVVENHSGIPSKGAKSIASSKCTYQSTGTQCRTKRLRRFAAQN
jgi:hypothetical protein